MLQFFITKMKDSIIHTYFSKRNNISIKDKLQHNNALLKN